MRTIKIASSVFILRFLRKSSDTRFSFIRKTPSCGSWHIDAPQSLPKSRAFIIEISSKVNTLKVSPLLKDSSRIIRRAVTRNIKISGWSTGAAEEGHAIRASEPPKFLSAATKRFFIFLLR